MFCGKQNKGDDTIRVFQNAITIQQKFGKGKKKLFIFTKLVFYFEDKKNSKEEVKKKKSTSKHKQKNVKNKNYIPGP